VNTHFIAAKVVLIFISSKD